MQSQPDEKTFDVAIEDVDRLGRPMPTPVAHFEDRARLPGDYAGIVEIFESRTPQVANDFLARGYELLRIEGVSVSGQHPAGGTWPQAGAFFVARHIRYILGRTADVPHVDLNMMAAERAAGVVQNGDTLTFAGVDVARPE